MTADRAAVGRSRQRAGRVIAKTSLVIGVVAFLACAFLAPGALTAIGALTFMGAGFGVWLVCIGIMDGGPPDAKAPPT